MRQRRREIVPADLWLAGPGVPLRRDPRSDMDSLMRQGTTTVRGFQPVRSACGLLTGLIVAWSIGGEGLARAERQGGKVQPGREQGTGNLFSGLHDPAQGRTVRQSGPAPHRRAAE